MEISEREQNVYNMKKRLFNLGITQVELFLYTFYQNETGNKMK